MSTFAKIVLTPNALTPISDRFQVEVISGTDIDQEVYEICAASRTARNWFTQGTTIQQHIDNLFSAIVADYPYLLLVFNLTKTATSITLTADIPGVQFINKSDANWSAVITPETTSLAITSITASGVLIGNKNNRATFKVNFSDNAGDVTISSPIQQTISQSPFTFDWDRNPVPQADVIITDGTSNVSVKLPRVTMWNRPEVSVAQRSNGIFDVTLIATRQFLGEIDTAILYSLDGQVYQDSNVFYGVGVGFHAAYIRDSCAGSWFTFFEIEGYDLAKPEPFFDISRVNSLTFRDGSLYGTFKALFERQKFTNIEVQKYFQDFKSSDSPVTQLRSSYDNITATLRSHCTDEELGTYQVIKKITNIDKKDKRDCIVKSNGLGEIYVYFTTGATYTPGTTDIIGSYNLTTAAGTKLEPWMEAGNVITLTGGAEGVYYVDRRAYVSGIGWVLVVKLVYDGAKYNATAEQAYNAENWDVSEFISDFSSLEKGKYYIVVNATDPDPRYPAVEWISEPFEISDCEDCVELEYSTSDRTIKDIVPDTGIVHKIRVPASFYEADIAPESEFFQTDSQSAVMLRLDNFIRHKLSTDPIPEYLATKILDAIGHDDLFIDSLEHTYVNSNEYNSWIKQNNPFGLLSIVLQYNDSTISTDETGIVSGQAGNVMGAGTLNVIGA